MQQYTTLPETVYAEQLTRDNVEELARLCGGQVIIETDPRNPDNKYVALNVPTLSGVKRASEGQMLIKYQEGSWGVMGATAFRETFGPA